MLCCDSVAALALRTHQKCVRSVRFPCLLFCDQSSVTNAVLYKNIYSKIQTLSRHIANRPQYINHGVLIVMSLPPEFGIVVNFPYLHSSFHQVLYLSAAAKCLLAKSLSLEGKLYKSKRVVTICLLFRYKLLSVHPLQKLPIVMFLCKPN